MEETSTVGAIKIIIVVAVEEVVAVLEAEVEDEEIIVAEDRCGEEILIWSVVFGFRENRLFFFSLKKVSQKLNCQCKQIRTRNTNMSENQDQVQTKINNWKSFEKHFYILIHFKGEPKFYWQEGHTTSICSDSFW